MIEIRRLVEKSDFGDTTTHAVEVYVKGKKIGGGGFGGEPEDNSEKRDYAWVMPLIKRLSKMICSSVEETEEDIYG